MLEEWFTEVRPLFGTEGNPAAWPSERGTRVGCQRLNSRFVAYRETLGLDTGLDFHSLRRSYVTHLIEDGFDPRFVQEQAGHEHASTTSIYTKSRELHQMGEKPQVTRSAWRGSGASNSCVAAA
ncbi:MAG: site-specific integrase [Pseudonocardiaceae bacterium]